MQQMYYKNCFVREKIWTKKEGFISTFSVVCNILLFRKLKKK